MSSSESGDTSPTATPPPPPEELPDQPFKDHESFTETGSALSGKTSSVVQAETEIDALMSPTTPLSEEQFPHQSDKDHHDGTEETGLQFAGDTPTPDQAGISNHGHAGLLLAAAEATAGAEVESCCQPEDDSRANSVLVVTPGEPDENPRILLDGPMPAVQEEKQTPSTADSFGLRESPSLLPVTSSPVVPTSDEPPAPLTDLKTEQEPPLVSVHASLAASAEDMIDTESCDGNAGGDENDNAGKIKIQIFIKPRFNRQQRSKGQEKLANEPKEFLTSDKEDADDGEINHNPFDFKGTLVQAKLNESSLDPSSVLQNASVNDLWERMRKQGERSDALDQLMVLVGLENVKMQFLKIKAIIDAARRRKGWLRRQDLNMVILGNPGTGKTTVAAIYKRFLIESKVWPENESQDIEIYDDVDRSWYGLPVKNRLSDSEVTVMTGSVTGVSKLLGGRPHSRWECWRRIQLQDYDDEQLRVMLLRLIERNNLQIDGGLESPYPLMVARRVGRGRNTDGFGNIHEIKLAFEQTLERQAYRLKQAQLTALRRGDISITSRRDESGAKLTSDDSEAVLTMEDFMGPEPAELWEESAAWKRLDRMAGLEDVKKAVRSLMRLSKTNYRRELQGKEPLQMSLNRLFLGPPGTGKTTVAKLYGEILGELGLVSSKEVIITTPSDFIGPYTGQTEQRTSSIIESAAGKALIIDDAHTFFTRDETSFLGDDLDSFRRACIDTLVSRIHNRPGEDRSVILIGYADKMEDMFQKCNPGLKRRFPLEEAFRFHDYDDKQLNEILRIKMAKEEITASKKAMDVAAEVLRRARDRPNFGNGGDVDNLLNQAKARFRERKAAEKEKHAVVEGDAGHGAAAGANGEAGHHGDNRGDQDSLEEEDRVAIVLEPRDFDPEWDRGINPESGGKASSLFDGLLGFDEIRKQFEGYQLMAANMRRRGKDPRESIPFTYVFKGPPGTGKTHTARIMGKMFYRMGFLSTDEVVECSASHMIGQYSGQTAPKVVSLLDSALGKVLFIDEAYRLTSSRGGRGFESEAIGELVDCMTKPRYLRKMIIILAGYNKDMSQLLKSNAGLRGRFPTEIRFRPMDEGLSRDHLVKLLSKQDITIHDEKKPSSDDHETVLRLFCKLGVTEGWSNGRDIQSLANVITAEVYKRIPPITVESDGNSESEAMSGGVKGEEKETSTSVGAGADADASNFDSLHISTKDLIKFLKDLLRERIKAAGSGDNSGNQFSGVAQ